MSDYLSVYMAAGRGDCVAGVRLQSSPPAALPRDEWGMASIALGRMPQGINYHHWWCIVPLPGLGVKRRRK
jgi:hypothetical protein